jgi:hypothetical protein
MKQMREEEHSVQRNRDRQARRAVSRKLVLYHKSLLDALSEDSISFFERVMEEAEQDISAHGKRQ